METEAMPQTLPRQMLSSFCLPTTSFPRLATAPQALSYFLLLTFYMATANLKSQENDQEK
jgi:hypothetical protein